MVHSRVRPRFASACALGLAVLLGAPPLAAAGRPTVQEPQDQAQLLELRKVKLAKPVFKLAPWLTDYDKAREKAKKDKKFILVYFTRSYAH